MSPRQSSTPSTGRSTSAKSSSRGARINSGGHAMRRSVSILFVLLVVLGMGVPLAAQPESKSFPKPFRPPFTPSSLWTQLMKGNTAYKGGALPYTDIDDARERTKDKQ